MRAQSWRLCPLGVKERPIALVEFIPHRLQNLLATLVSKSITTVSFSVTKRIGHLSRSHATNFTSTWPRAFLNFLARPRKFHTKSRICSLSIYRAAWSSGGWSICIYNQTSIGRASSPIGLLNLFQIQTPWYFQGGPQARFVFFGSNL